MATNANEILDRLAALLDAATPFPEPDAKADDFYRDPVGCAYVAIRNAAPALIRLARAAIAVKDWKGDTSLFDACEEHEAALKALGEVRL